MNEENEETLRKHPVFAELSYFECNDGWFNLLDAFGKAVSEGSGYPEEASPSLVEELPMALQVKEKFGSCRLYMGPVNRYVAGLVTMTERISNITCEVCGNAGQQCAVKGWYQVLCDEHRLSPLEYLATTGESG